MKHICLATKLSSSKRRCRETCSCLPGKRGHCGVTPRLGSTVSPGGPGSCAEGARPSGRKLPELGSAMKCLSQAHCSSRALIKLRCVSMYGQIQKSIFLKKERHEFPPVSAKGRLCWCLERRRAGSHIWKPFAHSYKM